MKKRVQEYTPSHKQSVMFVTSVRLMPFGKETIGVSEGAKKNLFSLFG